MMDDETWFNAKKAVELGFADKILFSSGETDEEKKKPDKPEKEPEEGSDGEEGKEKEDEDKDKKKKFPFQQDSMMYSTKAMNESFLSRVSRVEFPCFKELCFFRRDAYLLVLHAFLKHCDLVFVTHAPVHGVPGLPHL